METIWLENEGRGQWNVDDLSRYAGGETREEAFRNGLRTLQVNLRARRKGGVTLEINKTQLFHEEIKLLGFFFEKDGKKASGTKAIKLAGWRAGTVKESVGFLAPVNYLRGFYDPRVLTRRGEELRAYVRKGEKPIGEFKADARAQECAQELREGLKWYKLMPYGGGGRLIVMTDASDYGVGGAIFGAAEDFEETEGLVTSLKSDQLVGVFSRSFSSAEGRWGVFEKEVFSVIQACEHYPLILDPGIRVVFFH